MVMGMSSYPTEAWAIEQVTQWQNRHDRGGRPDITRDMLLNMEPRRSHEVRPCCSRVHVCPFNSQCHLPVNHDGRCNTFDPDGHP